jgi:hypothetical protein
MLCTQVPHCHMRGHWNTLQPKQEPGLYCPATAVSTFWHAVADYACLKGIGWKDANRPEAVQLTAELRCLLLCGFLHTVGEHCLAACVSQQQQQQQTNENFTLSCNRGPAQALSAQCSTAKFTVMHAH